MLKETFNNKTILVTGGTGSFGKKFIEIVLKYHNPKKVICYSRDELKQFDFKNNIKDPKNKLRFFLGDVRDLRRLNQAFEKVDIVVHAAALKQVVSGEYNPFEVVQTNIIGTQNVCEAILTSSVKKGIFLSTDKAVSPVNLYGATKLTAEKLFISSNNYNTKKKFSVVRYGNVFYSRGSVAPIFYENRNSQLKLTHKDMTRFNITLVEAVNFVIKCTQRMWGGETFVPKMDSIKIIDLIKTINPKKNFKIIGSRPGEKLHEELISKNDVSNVIEFKDYFVILPSILDFLSWNIKEFSQKSSEKKGIIKPKSFEYNSTSDKKFLSIKQIKKLLDVHSIAQQ